MHLRTAPEGTFKIAFTWPCVSGQLPSSRTGEEHDRNSQWFSPTSPSDRENDLFKYHGSRRLKYRLFRADASAPRSWAIQNQQTVQLALSFSETVRSHRASAREEAPWPVPLSPLGQADGRLGLWPMHMACISRAAFDRPVLDRI
jgi:hypothetical protein